MLYKNVPERHLLEDRELRLIDIKRAQESIEEIDKELESCKAKGAEQQAVPTAEVEAQTST